MLVQYNFIDETNSEAISQANRNGMGVAIMGPVGGGRLAGVGPDYTRLIPTEYTSPAALALNFVWSNPDITTALSGMDSENILIENVQTAANYTGFTSRQKGQVKELKEKLAGLNEIYCSGCSYCLPCEQGVNIPGIFHLLICHEILEAKAYAKRLYSLFGVLPIVPGKDASSCIECGDCEEKCPQGISIIDQLKHTHELLL